MIRQKYNPTRMIGEELFYNVQDILNGRKKNIKNRSRQKPELALRGFLACKRCGGNLTGSASKGTGGRYFYYHCQPGCPERIKADVANSEAIKELKKIPQQKEAIKLYRIILEKELKKSAKESTVDKEKVVAEIKKNQERIDNAQQLMLDGELPLLEYKSIKGRYEEAIRELQEQISGSSPRIADWKKYLDFGFNLLESLDRFYEEAKPAFKLQTISSMYAEKLIFENNSYRTPSTERNLPYYSMPAEATAKIKKDKINKINFVLAGHLRRRLQ